MLQIAEKTLDSRDPPLKKIFTGIGISRNFDTGSWCDVTHLKIRMELVAAELILAQ